MSNLIPVGLDFGSFKYTAAYVQENTIVPIPVTANDPSWIGLIILKPTDTGLTFTSMKQQLGTGQSYMYLGKKQNVEDIVKNQFVEIKKSVEEYAGESINKLVVSVPSRYASFRRSDIVKIATYAGFPDVSLINDCTAAAIGFSFDQSIETSTLLVFSMGYIGFEVSLLRIMKGQIREIAHEGSDGPAGCDFELEVMKYCLEYFEKRGTPLPTKTYRNHWLDLGRISSQVIQQLSMDQEASMVLPSYITGNKIEKINITRSDLNKLFSSHIAMSMNQVDDIIEDANLSYNDIDKVLLLGGVTHSHFIQENMEKRFGEKVITLSEDILARGAAVQASRLVSQKNNSDSDINDELSEKKGIDSNNKNTLQYTSEDNEEKFQSDSTENEILEPDIEPLINYINILVNKGDTQKAKNFFETVSQKIESIIIMA